MKIIDLGKEHIKDYLCCLEPWSDEMKESGDGKEKWFAKAKKKGLRVKLAVDDDGSTAGMIQYLPIEESNAEGEDLYFIQCIWVHGHKEGIGNRQGKGIGISLLEAAEEDARKLGAKGIAAWGIGLPFWMKASWFKKHGYKKADKNSMAILLWKPFDDKAKPPRWIKRKKKPGRVSGKVSVDVFVNGWCAGHNITYERAKRAASEFGDKVVFTEYNTYDKKVLDEWGISDDLFINGKSVISGPPPKYEKIYKIIEKRARKLD